MAAPVPVRLDPQRRGDPFSYSSALQGSWIASNFPGGFFFTLRGDIPASAQADDEDEYSTSHKSGVVAQATSDDGEITFADDTHFTVALNSDDTNGWPLTTLHWDLVGVVSATVRHTISSGTVLVYGDVTRGH